MPRTPQHGKRVPTPLNKWVRDLDIDTERIAYENNIGKDKLNAHFRGSKSNSFTPEETLGICRALGVTLERFVKLSKESRDYYVRHKSDKVKAMFSPEAINSLSAEERKKLADELLMSSN